jgi:hypothetical protein
MATDSESFNRDLYDLLKVRGYKPVPLNSKNQRVPASQSADVMEFTFVKDDKEYGKAWVSIDDVQNVIVYYDSEQQDSPNNITPGVEYDDTWTGFLKNLKTWAQRRQLSFELSNKDRLGDDMRQREYYKMKEKVSEGYYPMGKKASYNDAVPNVKIILQHNRNIEEGEQRYRNVARIYLENVDGERFLAPTNKPGVARVYARHIAEGGLPNDERWNHIKGLCEEYNKMAGFVRATRNKQFNESAQALVNEGLNHYNKLRENLNKMTGHRGYTAYFESWTPTLMENENDSSSINELFVQETTDPRIESVMPILARLQKKVNEMSEVNELAEWADGIANEHLEEVSDPYKKDEMKDFKTQQRQGLKSTNPDLKNVEDLDDIEEATGTEKMLRKIPGFKRYQAGEKSKDNKTLANLMLHGEIEGDSATDPKDINLGKSAARAAQRFDKIAKGKKPFSNEEVEEALEPWMGKDLDTPAYLRKKKYDDAKKDAELGGPKLRRVKDNPEEVKETAYEKDLADHEPRKVSGVYGAKSKSFNKKFKNQAAQDKFFDHPDNEGNYEIHYVSKVDETVEEDLDANQKRAGQLGPTEKVKNNNIGKLVGANESAEFPEELQRIMDIARFRL